MPTPATIRPYPPEPRGFGPFPEPQEVPPEDGCAYFMAMGDKAREEIARREGS